MKSVNDNLTHFSWFWVKDKAMSTWFHVKLLKLSDLSVNGKIHNIELKWNVVPLNASDCFRALIFLELEFTDPSLVCICKPYPTWSQNIKSFRTLLFTVFTSRLCMHKGTGNPHLAVNQSLKVCGSYSKFYSLVPPISTIVKQTAGTAYVDAKSFLLRKNNDVPTVMSNLIVRNIIKTVIFVHQMYK